MANLTDVATAAGVSRATLYRYYPNRDALLKALAAHALAAEQVELDLDEKERLIEAPIRAVFERGVETGVLRQDIPLDVLRELFGGVLLAAAKLATQPEIGIAEASAAATSVFLTGAQPH